MNAARPAPRSPSPPGARTLRDPRSTLAALAILAAAAAAACAPSERTAEAANVVPEDDVRAMADAARERLGASEGGQLVLRAIEAHGGLEAWYRAPTSSYTWEYANVGSDLRFQSFLVVDNRSRKVYHDLLVTGPFDERVPVDARFAFDGEIAWMWPDSIRQPNPRFWSLSGFYFEQIPFVLADPGLHYERLPDEELDGETYHMARVSFGEGVGDSPGDRYTLYVHPQTGTVRAIRYTVTFGREVTPDTEPRETLFAYEDYVTVDGLTVPTSFKGYWFTPEGGRGDFKNEAFADSISFRRPFDPSRLTAPDGARMYGPPGS